jgi:hypothetical protein
MRSAVLCHKFAQFPFDPRVGLLLRLGVVMASHNGR